MTQYYQCDVEELKRRKKEFIDSLIQSNVSYNLCGTVSSLLNEFINEIDIVPPPVDLYK
jgi:hypothetical protein